MRQQSSSAWTTRHALSVLVLFTLAPLARAGRAPLFQPEAPKSGPSALAALAAGVGATPNAAALASLSVVYAGDHAQVGAWDLAGPLTAPDSRIACGAATLMLSGFKADGTAGLSARAAHIAGHCCRCWDIPDMDHVRQVPDWMLKEITDGEGIAEGTEEAGHYAFFLSLAHRTSQEAFVKASRKDISTIHLKSDPDVYRGKVVQMEGVLRRVNRFSPTPEARLSGINDIYEAWVFPEALNAQAYCFRFTDWPAGLSRDLLGKSMLDGSVRVKVVGYFFKNYGYDAGINGKKRTAKVAPLIIGNTLEVIPAGSRKGESMGFWVRPLIYAVPIMLLVLIVTVVGVTYWLRRADGALHKRLLAARAPEFVPPPPDAVPVAAPVQPAAQPRPPPAPIPQRMNLPRRGRGEDSSPPGPSGPSEAGDKPPGEDAGV